MSVVIADGLIESSSRMIALYSDRIIGSVDPDACDSDYFGIPMAGVRTVEGGWRGGEGAA